MKKKLTEGLLLSIQEDRCGTPPMSLANLCSKYGLSRGSAYSALQLLGCPSLRTLPQRLPLPPKNIKTIRDIPHKSMTKAVGDASVAVIMAEIIKRGVSVLIPFGDKDAYDLVIDLSGSFKRIQCKTAWIDPARDYALIFNTSSNTGHNPKTRKRATYQGLIDGFAVWSPEFDLILWVPFEKAPSTSMMINMSPKNNHPKIHRVSDFEFDSLFLQ